MNLTASPFWPVVGSLNKNGVGWWGGVEVWTSDSLVRWDWDPPEIYQGFDSAGRRTRLGVEYDPYEWDEFGYLTGSWWVAWGR